MSSRTDTTNRVTALHAIGAPPRGGVAPEGCATESSPGRKRAARRPLRFLRAAATLGFACAMALTAAVPSASAATPTQLRYLYYYHHYANFSYSACSQLPPSYVPGCRYGAKQQMDFPPPHPVPIARRRQLFWLYTHHTGFSYTGCRLLPTDSVEGCQERYPARKPAAPPPPTQYPIPQASNTAPGPIPPPTLPPTVPAASQPVNIPGS